MDNCVIVRLEIHTTIQLIVFITIILSVRLFGLQHNQIEI
jgi:hypothetical protein